MKTKVTLGMAMFVLGLSVFALTVATLIYANLTGAEGLGY